MPYFRTRTLGAYGPLVLAPAEGLGALRASCRVGVILSFCISVFLSFLSLCTVQYSTVWYSTVQYILFQKNAENNFKKKHFWGTSKNWRLDPKVFADSSWASHF